MTEPVECHKGKCRYKDEKLNDECVDCDESEAIEHDLMKEVKQ